MSSQQQVATISQQEVSNAIFNVNINSSGEWAQNIVAAHLSLLSKSLLSIMQELRQAEVEFTNNVSDAEKASANSTRDGGLAEAVQGVLLGGASVVAGGLGIWAAGKETEEMAAFDVESKKLTQRSADLDREERGEEGPGAAQDGGSEELAARRRRTPEERQAETKKARDKLKQDFKDLQERKDDCRTKWRNFATRLQELSNSAQITQLGTKTAGANANANAGLQKANANIAQTGERVLDGTYSETDQTLTGAQSAAGGVYASSSRIAG